jgi:methyl-accepting chemotaxis protein
LDLRYRLTLTMLACGTVPPAILLCVGLAWASGLEAELSPAASAEMAALWRSQNARWLAGAAGAIGVALAASAALAWRSATHLERRLERIRDVAERVARGRFDLFARIDGHDEAAHLARAVNTIVYTVASTLQETDALVDGLAARVASLAGPAAENADMTNADARSADHADAPQSEFDADAPLPALTRITGDLIALHARLDAAARSARDVATRCATRESDLNDRKHDLERFLGTLERFSRHLPDLADAAQRVNILALNIAIEAARDERNAEPLAALAEETRGLLQRFDDLAAASKKGSAETVAATAKAVGSVDNLVTLLRESAETARSAHDLIASAANDAQSMAPAIAAIMPHVEALDSQLAEQQARVAGDSKKARSIVADINTIRTRIAWCAPPRRQPEPSARQTTRADDAYESAPAETGEEPAESRDMTTAGTTPVEPDPHA